MTTEELIKIARKSGAWETIAGQLVTDDINIAHFADLITEREREECAKIADNWPNRQDDVCLIGVAIRARKKMKLMFTQQEIEEIILAHVNRGLYDKFNTIEIQNWRNDEFVIVTYVEPTFEEPSNET